jgi:hypothetical protein
MLLVREVFHCKPGKVRALVEKFQAMAKLPQSGVGKMRLMTDFAGPRYWTLVAEMEVPDMKTFEESMQGAGMDPESTKKMENIMKDYHDLIDHGHREIYKIEA